MTSLSRWEQVTNDFCCYCVSMRRNCRVSGAIPSAVSSSNPSYDKPKIETSFVNSNSDKIGASDLFINYWADLPNYHLAFKNLAQTQVIDQTT